MFFCECKILSFDLNSALSNFVMPITISLLVYFVASKRDEIKRRKDQSMLGAVILADVQKEVDRGIELFKDYLNGKFIGIAPRKSWYGMESIPNDVLIRIISIFRKKKIEIGFHPCEIRNHCKNYFEHILPKIENELLMTKDKSGLKSLLLDSKFLEAAEGVSKLLTKAIDSLNDNVDRVFPK